MCVFVVCGFSRRNVCDNTTHISHVYDLCLHEICVCECV